MFLRYLCAAKYVSPRNVALEMPSHDLARVRDHETPVMHHLITSFSHMECVCVCVYANDTFLDSWE